MIEIKRDIGIDNDAIKQKRNSPEENKDMHKKRKNDKLLVKRFSFQVFKIELDPAKKKKRNHNNEQCG
jgi:hypothetical protein